MHNLKDYVNMVARSMAIELNEERLDKVTWGLINNKHYKNMLEDLEAMIKIGKEGN